ncbi:hypothetical protein [Paenibacillus sp. NRS-1781]|uniref:hypothetical protein n=1 Tax=Paenibacillus sp. NRS-1781 TaxID=3233905 RepID=UPI003D2E671E
MQFGIKATTGNKHLQKQYGGSPMLDDLLKSKGYRKLIIHRYLVFYLINEDETRPHKRPRASLR